MADLSLDDLIKKDKEQHKLNRTANKNTPKPFKKNGKFADRFEGRQKGNSSWDDEKPRHHKQKFIKKQFDRPRREEQRQQKFKNKPVREERRQEPADQTPKQFRTLKVLGLSPQFTNQDLYKLFATEGALEKCLIEQDNFGRSLNTALVKYHQPESARSAIQNLNRHKIMNCVLGVEPYKNVKKYD